MTPTQFAELRAAGFTTGVRHFPGRVFHYARCRHGFHTVVVIHDPDNRKALLAFAHAVTGRAGYTITRSDWLVSAARVAITDLVAGHGIPGGFHAADRPLQLRLPHSAPGASRLITA